MDHARARALGGWRQYARCWPGRGRGGAGKTEDFGVWGICARNDDSAGRDAPGAGVHILAVRGGRPLAPAGAACQGLPIRSEEHTSELQSLMRISYAVFCLQKKNYKHNM